jgi:hypothetical protein
VAVLVREHALEHQVLLGAAVHVSRKA